MGKELTVQVFLGALCIPILRDIEAIVDVHSVLDLFHLSSSWFSNIHAVKLYKNKMSNEVFTCLF